MLRPVRPAHLLRPAAVPVPGPGGVVPPVLPELRALLAQRRAGHVPVHGPASLTTAGVGATPSHSSTSNQGVSLLLVLFQISAVILLPTCHLAFPGREEGIACLLC